MNKLKKEYINNVNMLKLDKKNMDDNNIDNLIKDLEKILSLKKTYNNTESKKLQDEILNINVEEEKEKGYIQSLKSSLYSEKFQKNILEKILLAKSLLLKGNLSYINTLKKMEKDIDDKIKMLNTDCKEKKIFLALKKILNGIANEDVEIGQKIMLKLIEILNQNIKNIKEINTKKREIINVILKAQSGDLEAKTKIIELMKPDIEKYAKKISSFNSGKRKLEFEMLYDDLCQEGLIGVLRGIQKFSPKKSDNVREYMKFWINQSMLSYITKKAHIIRIPAHVRQLFIKITRILEKYDGIEGINTKAIAKELGLSEDKIIKIINHGKLGQTIFLSDIIGDEEESSLDNFSFMKDFTICGPEESVLQKEELTELQEAIKEVLTQEEKMVIIHRFGLFGADKLLLKDLGEKLGKTEERIRQIEARAIQMLSIKFFDKKYGKNFREELKKRFI